MLRVLGADNTTVCSSAVFMLLSYHSPFFDKFGSCKPVVNTRISLVVLNTENFKVTNE
jgi:hypothetical protein